MAMINDVDFSDLYITPGKRAYMWSGKTPYGLKEVMFDDYDEFVSQIYYEDFIQEFISMMEKNGKRIS